MSSKDETDVFYGKRKHKNITEEVKWLRLEKEKVKVHDENFRVLKLMQQNQKSKDQK